MTKTAERFDLVTTGIPMDAAQMQPSEFGDWIHFDQHKAKMSAVERKVEILEGKLSDHRIKATKKAYGEFMQSLVDAAENTRLRLTHMHDQASAALTNGDLLNSDTYKDLAELQAKLEAFLEALQFREVVEWEHEKVEDQLRAWAQRMTREIVAFTPASPSRNEHYLAWLGDIMRGAQRRFPDL